MRRAWTRASLLYTLTRRRRGRRVQGSDARLVALGVLLVTVFTATRSCATWRPTRRAVLSGGDGARCARARAVAHRAALSSGLVLGGTRPFRRNRGRDARSRGRGHRATTSTTGARVAQLAPRAAAAKISCFREQRDVIDKSMARYYAGTVAAAACAGARDTTAELDSTRKKSHAHRDARRSHQRLGTASGQRRVHAEALRAAHGRGVTDDRETSGPPLEDTPQRRLVAEYVAARFGGDGALSTAAVAPSSGRIAVARGLGRRRRATGRERAPVAATSDGVAVAFYHFGDDRCVLVTTLMSSPPCRAAPTAIGATGRIRSRASTTRPRSRACFTRYGAGDRKSDLGAPSRGAHPRRNPVTQKTRRRRRDDDGRRRRRRTHVALAPTAASRAQERRGSAKRRARHRAAAARRSTLPSVVGGSACASATGR